ncbi:hypothetical protein [Microbacterium hominis]|uniref:Uncharacterized protein n=1 Tax=Microbacterium hominis TaxID=162426 RepID=A0A7D4PZY2_9MICO|nr:hypothetical protein [Microbacterium hominis]QKJ18732.1 hypothetical protein HQM25_04595 [Microbacterium hominis]
MTDIDFDVRFHEPLRTDDQLRLALEDLLQCANLPQLWFIFLDEDQHLVGPFMPGDGYPDDPAQPVDTDDLGTVPSAEVMAVRVGMIAELVGAAHAVLVWERPGPDRLTEGVRAWVRAVAAACLAREVSLRAQLLLHDDGLRMLVPDDWV